MVRPRGASVIRVGMGIGLGRLSLLMVIVLSALRVLILTEKPRSRFLSREESPRGSLS